MTEDGCVSLGILNPGDMAVFDTGHPHRAGEAQDKDRYVDCGFIV